MKAKIDKNGLVLIPETKKDRIKINNYLSDKIITLMASSESMMTQYYIDNIWISVLI